MFLVLLSYKKPLAEVDRHIAAHMEFLARHYASGEFLLSGRKQPRSGGVILATAADRAQMEAIVRSDPFVREGVADYEIIEFIASSTAPALHCVREAL
jgi:uncharacterized protein YciI